jgi:hypothetical protein
MRHSLIRPSDAATIVDSTALTIEEISERRIKLETAIEEEIMRFYRDTGGVKVVLLAVNVIREPWVGNGLPAGATLTRASVRATMEV